MEDTSVRHLTFSEAVLCRPKMYTIEGTFGEVVSFLEGYYSGMAKADAKALPVSEWEAFQQWLAGYLNVDSAEVFTTILQTCADSQAALTKLSDLLKEFLRTKREAQSENNFTQ